MINTAKIKSFISRFTSLLSRADQILIGMVVFVGIISVWILFLFRTPGDSVQIYVDNKFAYQFDLAENGLFDISTSYGSLELKISDRSAWILNSTCPAKICKKMGKISSSNQSIVCLPNRVLICIKGKKNKQWIDLITQ